MGKRKRRVSRRVRKLLASGGVPFTCSDCPGVFASQRDLEHHVSDAHFKKVMTMVRRHQHQEQSHLSLVPQHANANTDLLLPPTKQEPGPFARLFTSNKDKSEILVIDFVSPHGCIECEEDGCAYGAIPLTGFCEKHDPLCRLILKARLLKAADAKKPEVPPLVSNAEFDNDADLYAAGYGYKH